MNTLTPLAAQFAETLRAEAFALRAEANHGFWWAPHAPEVSDEEYNRLKALEAEADRLLGLAILIEGV